MRELISGIWTKERREWAKRKMAALLCAILVIQAALPAQLSFAASVPGAGEKNVIELQGDPDEAFDYIRARVGDKIGSGGDSLSLYFYFGLNDDYRDEKLAEYIENGTLVDVYDFEHNGAYEDLKKQYGSYDSYLLDQDGLENPEFTCTINEGLLDVLKIREYLESNPDIITTKGDIIGTWEIENTSDGPQFRVVTNNIIYNRSNIIANKGMQLSLTESYEPGTDVDAGQGSGKVDIEITVNGEGTPTATDSNYEMEKFADISEEDPSAIIYTVMAYATSSDAAAVGTDSNASKATGSDISAYSYDDDEDEDGYTEPDSKDMDLIFDLEMPEAPVHSRYVRTRESVNGGTVVASDSNLVGKYVSDTISDGLVLEKVMIYDGYDWRELGVDELGSYENWEEYLEDNGRTFFYQIEGEDGETDPEKAVVQIFGVQFHTRLSEAGWREYASKGELHKVFPNRAALKDDDQTTTLTTSNKVDPRIDWSSMLEKEGLPLDVSGKVYRWDIDTTTQFTDGVQLYAVDSLKDIDNTHTYIWDDPEYPVTITRDGQTDTLTVEKLDAADVGAAGAEHIDFENLTINDIQKILGDKYLDGTAYIYEYEYADSVSQEMKRAAIMLIPLADYANGKSRITYYTDITKANENGLNYSTSIQNKVKAVWKWNEGGGPGISGDEPFGTVVIEKKYDIDVKPVGKEGVDYDEMTNLITWEFEVNRPGVAMDELWIEDALDLNESSWAGVVAAGESLTLTGYERRMTDSPARKQEIIKTEPSGKDLEVVSIPEAADDPEAYADQNYYTVTERGGDQDKQQVLTIHLKDVGADDYYRFRVQSYVENRNYVVSTLEIKNTAEYWGTAGDQEIKKHEVTAQQKITHTLIAKSVEPFEGDGGYLYDYESNTVQWKVRINEKGLPITSAVITDELPLGVTFPQSWSNSVTKAARINGAAAQYGIWEAGEDTAGTITFADGVRIDVTVAENMATAENGKDYSKDTLTFAFKNADGSDITINSKYEITFLTQLDEDFRREVVKSNQVTKLVNHAKLDGTIDGRPVNTGLVAAENEAVPKPLVKEGTYHGKTGSGKYEKYDYQYYDENDILQHQEVEAAYFNWTAYVNRTGADMLGVTISDAVADCFELVDASLNIDVIRLDASGNPVPGGETRIVENRRPYNGAAELTNLTADESGFRFTIPEEYRNSVLKLSFDTVLVDDAVAEEMTNQITAEGDGWSDSSDKVTDKKADDFQIEDYAQAEGMFFLRVVKTSATTDALALKGAEFKLTRMTIDRGADRSEIQNWKETSSVKTRTTNARGVLNFMFLRANEMYKLVEVTPPVGYDKIDTEWYVIIRPETGAVFPQENTTVVGETPVEVLIEKDRNYINTGIKNNPNGVQNTTNNLKLKKLGQNSQRLAGVEFGLYLDNRRVKAGVTDGDGILELEDLDPLKEGRYYLLKEITPEGYETATPIRVYITAKRPVDGGADTYTMRLTITDENGHETDIDSENEHYLVKNDAIRRDGSFGKVDQNGDPVTGFDVAFDVFRRGDGGFSETGSEPYTVVMVPQGEGSGEYKPYNPMPVVTSSKGIIKLNGLYYGDYKLQEQANDDKLLQTAAPIYIRVNDKGVFALPAGNYTDEEAAAFDDDKYVVNLNNASNLKVENELKWGMVQVNKAVGKYNADGTESAQIDKNGNAVFVSGALFAIYRGKDGSQESDPMTYVKTGKDGRFLMLDESKGQYQCFDQDGKELKKTGKVLPVGSYSLKEVKAADDSYEVKTGVVGFDIEAGTGAGADYKPADAVVISTDAQGKPVVSSDADGLFLNMPVRNGVKLQKVDGKYGSIKLNNAEFHVFESTGKTAVAELLYDQTVGGYVLKPLYTTGDNCVTCTKSASAENDAGLPYLELNKDGKSYGLLAGTYKIKETKAPVLIGKDGVQYPNVYPSLSGSVAQAMLEITAAEAKLQTVTGSNIFKDKNTFKNQPKLGQFKIDKYVQKPVKNPLGNEGEYSYQKAGAPFKFKLTPLELMHGNVTVDIKKHSMTSASNQGVVTFEQIPIGKYRLDEIDVPGTYKINNEWLVRKMPSIYVEVEETSGSAAADVKFYSDEKFTQLLDPKPADNSIAADQSSVYTNGVTNNIKRLIAYNSLKLSDLEGDKLAVLGNNSTPLASAEFTLTHNSLKYKFKYTTGADGKIIFNKIPYGSYTLEETKAPDGYEKIADISFTINAETYRINGNKPAGEQALKDKAITVNARFKKVDQNGDVIPSAAVGTKFEVTQTESLLGEALKGPFQENTDSTKKVVAVDENGMLEITGLPYGVYDVQELADSVNGKLDDTSKLAHFTLTVGKGEKPGSEGFWTKVTAKNVVEGNAVSKLLKTTFTSDSDGWHINEIAPNGTADFSATNANEPLMTNILLYGFVSIKKVRGEQSGDGTYTASNTPIAGAVFEIYKEGNDKTPYLTLKTDKTGSFPNPDQDGKYQDAVNSGVKKALIAGSYTLKESKIEGSTAYTIPDGGISFTVTGKDQTIWFYTDTENKLSQVAVKTGTSPVEGTAFMNIPKRGTLHFTKVDADTNAKLEGAIFGVYDGTALVGFAEYNSADSANGNYKLVTAERAEELAKSGQGWSLTTEKKDGSGNMLPYLSDRDGIGYLLAGSYTLKELKAPTDDYKLLTETMEAVITDGGDTAVNSAGAESGVVTNMVQKTAAALTFKKTVEENAYRPDISGSTANGFTFILKGKPSNSHEEWTEKTFTSEVLEGENGVFHIENIPVGTYELFEQKPAEDAYQGFDGKTEVKLLDLTVTAGASGEPKVEIIPTETAAQTEPKGIRVEVLYENGENPIITGAGITNHLKTGTVTGSKVARAMNGELKTEVPLEGIYFALYDSETAAEPIAKGTGAEAGKYLAVTDAEGNFRFEDVPYGIYWVGEYGTADGGVPEGYVRNTVRQQVKIETNGQEAKVPETFVNERLRGTAVLDKVSATDKETDGTAVKLSGAEFTVYANNGTAEFPSLGAKAAFLTEADGEPGHYVLSNTNSDHTETLEGMVEAGRIGAGLPYLEYDETTQTFWLAYGEYVVVETKTPAGYQPDVRQVNGRSLIPGTPGTSLLNLHPLTISGAQDQVWYIGNDGAAQTPQTFANTRSLADLRIIKQAELPTYNSEPQKFENGEGFRFEISGMTDDPGSADGLDLIAYLERAGRADFDRLVETDPVTGQKRVIITTDALGIAVLTGIPAGIYTVRELAEDGEDYQYLPVHDDNAERQVKIGFSYNTDTRTFDPSYEWTWTQAGNTNGSASSEIFKNHLKRGSIQGRKVAADNEAVGLEGAVFGLYTDESCTDDSRVMTATSSNGAEPEGSFSFDGVPYGTYYVKEIKAPSGYVPSTMQYRVEIRTEGAAVTEGSANGEAALTEIIFTNSNKRGSVQLTKKSDDGSGRTALMPGLAEFTIYAEEGCAENEAVAYLKDGDKDGVYTLTGAAELKQTVNGVRYLQADTDGDLGLIQGTYWLKETKIPDGYEAEMDGNAQRTYRFTIHSEDTETVQDLGTVIISNSGNEADEAFYNRLALGGFTLEKTIETSKADDLTMADGKTPGAGFVFEITGRDTVADSFKQIAEIPTLRINGEAPEAEDITADGGIRVMTGEDGTVRISGLPAGKYTVTETDGPDYELYTGTAPRTVTLKQSSDKAELLTDYDGTDTDPAADSLVFHNSLKRCTIAGQKVNDSGIALEGAKFGLYSENGTVLYRTAESLQNGRFTFTGIPVGEYVVKEIQAPSDEYTKDDREYRVSVRADMDTAAEILVSSGPIVNTLKRGNIEGRKLTDREAPLAGAVIGLFANGTTDFVEANLFEGRTAVSEEDGSFVFQNVPYGIYTVAEIKAPSGYGLNRMTTFVVRITQAGETVTTGYLAVPNKTPADAATQIVIVNRRNNNGGGGGGGSTPTGPSDPGGPGSLPIPNPNDVMLTTIEDNDVPLGQFLISIEDEDVPLALLPKTGNSGIPAALQAMALLGSLVGAMVLHRRKKDEETP